MCGFCGTAGFAEARCLESMNAAMVHRGPDDGGIEILHRDDGQPWIGLASRRLSVIDLSPAGHMPMTNEDGSIWLVYNGEVFDFDRLRRDLEARGHTFRSRTDTEVIIHLYEERGDDFLHGLNGMFGLALWDGARRRLVLARDPFGIKPVYYMPMPGNKLAFASEVKCFIAAGLLQPRINPVALHHYLNFLWVPGPRTMFEGVYKLPPGHKLVWTADGHQIARYWDGLPNQSFAERSEEELVENLRSLLEGSVRRQLVSDVPLGVFLSGGLDSSALLAIATRISNRSMKAYTIAFQGEDSKLEQSNEDPKFARLVAEKFHAEHMVIEIDPNIVDLLPKVVYHLDEPVADPAAITSYLICRAAREELTVLLSGQGGDEIFGGYRVHLADRLSRLFGWMPGFVRDRLLIPAWDQLPRLQNHLPGVRPGKVQAYHRYFAKLWRGLAYDRETRYLFQRSYYPPGGPTWIFSNEWRAQIADHDPYETHARFFAQCPAGDFVDRMLYVDQNTFLPELNLTYSDKTSMATSVEVRVPLLDREVARFMRSVPARYKISGMKQKYLFKKSMEGILPHDVIWRGKAGFGAPIRRWLGVDLRDLVDETLSESTLRKRGIFDPVAVDELVRHHREGRQDNTYQLWALLNFEVWMQTFID